MVVMKLFTVFSVQAFSRMKNELMIRSVFFFELLWLWYMPVIKKELGFPVVKTMRNIP